jgi:large subunit ribosomal protein L25
METLILAGTHRTNVGTKYTRRLRAAGKTPVIIYGHGQEPEAIALNTHDVHQALEQHSRLLAVEVEGRKEQYLIKAVQYDYLGTHPIHVDLMRVSMDERVRVQVEIVLRGTPKGAADGGVLTQTLSAVELECLVTAIPESLRVSVAHLGMGDALAVKDIEAPPGVTILADPDTRVAACSAPMAAPEPVEEAAETTAEPEVIGRAKEEAPAEEEPKK